MLQKLLFLLFALYIMGTVRAVSATRVVTKKLSEVISLRLHSPLMTKRGILSRISSYWELCEIETRLARAP